MIEFFGTPLLLDLPADDARQASLGDICRVDNARAGELVEALVQARKNAYVSQERVLEDGLPPITTQAFSIVRLLEETHLDLDSPSEILLTGILIGRTYSEMEERAKKSEKNVGKMLELMKKDPMKALRKMSKDIEKAHQRQAKK